jgi:site-specific DNA-cytosine methylase
MKVLSLFDGIACGRLALQRAGFDNITYYASEIDSYCIKIAQKNFPDIIQLGDVLHLPYMDIGKIDLLLGGSPCQDLSGAKPTGKGLQGDKSILFWKYVQILLLTKPKYFLFENVASMKQKDKDIITKELGVEPILINSSLVSAQSRNRLYWTDILYKGPPEDKNITLQDILIFPFNKNLIHSNAAINYMDRKVADGRTHWDFGHHSDALRNKKSSTIVANFYKGVPYNVLIDDCFIRKFDPIEVERLQTLPDNYTAGVSNTQRYKMLGNGWTVDVIAHILKNMEINNV